MEQRQAIEEEKRKLEQEQKDEDERYSYSSSLFSPLFIYQILLLFLSLPKDVYILYRQLAEMARLKLAEAEKAKAASEAEQQKKREEEAKRKEEDDRRRDAMQKKMMKRIALVRLPLSLVPLLIFLSPSLHTFTYHCFKL